MLRLIPRPVHRVALRIAHRVRHRWRIWRGTRIEGVSTILRDLEGRVVLVRHSYGTPSWCLPGGGLARGESPEDAVRRETREEIGCEVTGLRCIGVLDETISGSPHRAHVFLGTITDMPEADGREIAEARLFPANSLPEPLSKLTRARLELWREHMRAGS